MSERVVVIRTPDGELPACFMPKTVDLVGEGCPWATVQQMADDLGKAQFSYSASITDLAMDRDPPGRADCQARTDRVAAAAALLSSGSNP